jgi:tetratricopeptide (TPR) repeat protein
MLILAVSLLAQAAGQKTAAAAAGSGPSAVERALDRADYAAALRVAKSLPPSANTHVLAARAYMGQNDGAKALRELRAALRQNPKSLDALYYVSKLAGVLSWNSRRSRRIRAAYTNCGARRTRRKATVRMPSGSTWRRSNDSPGRRRF